VYISLVLRVDGFASQHSLWRHRLGNVKSFGETDSNVLFFVRLAHHRFDDFA
jgi:hypothetical protein